MPDTETDEIRQLASLDVPAQRTAVGALSPSTRARLLEFAAQVLLDNQADLAPIVESQHALPDGILLSDLRLGVNKRVSKLLRQTLIRRSALAIDAGQAERCTVLLLEAGKIRPLNHGLVQRLARAIKAHPETVSDEVVAAASDYRATAGKRLEESDLPEDERISLGGVVELAGIILARAAHRLDTPRATESSRQKAIPKANIDEGRHSSDAWTALELAETGCLEQARELYKKQSFVECEEYCRYLIAAGFPYAEAYKLCILALGKRHHFEDALQLARRALIEVDDTTRNIRQKIACATASGDYSLAIEFIADRFDKGENSGEFWAGIASFAWQRGDLGLAAVAATAAHVKSPSPEMKRLASRSAAAAQLLDLVEPSPVPINSGSVIDRLKNPPEPFVSEAIRKLLAGSPGSSFGIADRSVFDGPANVAVVGMHLGFGGSPQKALRLASRLSEKLGGPHVTLLCPEARTDRDPSEVSGDLDICVYGASDPAVVDAETDALLKLCGSRRRTHILALVQTLRRLRVDTVHAIGTMELLLEAAIASALSGARLCVLNPGMMRPDSYARKDVSRDEAKNYRSLLRAVADNPRYVIANNSQQAAADVSEWLDLPAPVVSVLRNGADLPGERSPSSADDRATLGFAADDFVISVVGRLAHEKFPELCLDVFAALKGSTRRPVRLLFVGDGPMRSALESSVRDRGLSESVRFTGFVEGPGRYYDMSDALLFLTRAEGLPNVVIEAQAHGVPVVASEGGGTSECIRHDVSGFLLPTLDPAPITDRLRQLVDSPTLTAQMAHQARAFAATHYGMQRMTADALALYAGGRVSALAMWRRDAKAFRRTPFTRDEVQGWAAVARAYADGGGIRQARQLMQMALRVDPDSRVCWNELMRAEALLARLPRAASLYAALTRSWRATGRIRADTATARLLDLGVAVTPDAPDAPDAPGILAPERVAEALRRDRWSVLRRVRERGGKAATARVRHAVEVQDAFTQAGLPLSDGEDPLIRLLDHARAPEADSAAGVMIWIGSLALGGGERQTANLLSELTRGSLKVDLLVDQPDRTRNSITSILEPQAISTIQDTSAETLDPRLAGLLAAMARPGATAARARLARLTAYFAAKRPAIVHVRGVAENALVVAAAALLAGAPRTIINIGTMLHSRQSDGRADTVAQHERNLAILNAIAAVPSTAFIFNSAGAQADWHSRVAIPAERSHVVANGFDRGAFDTALPASLEALPDSLDRIRAAGVAIVLGVFRFHHVKRPLLWVRTALELMEAGQACHFVIAGDGRLMAEAQQLVIDHQAQAHFSFLGAVDAGLAEIYRRADVLLHTASTESSPNVVLEAQAFGLPVVAPDVGGVKMVVREGDTALLVRRHSPKRYAEAVARALTPEMRRSAREMGPALVGAIAGPSRAAEEILEIYGNNEVSR